MANLESTTIIALNGTASTIGLDNFSTVSFSITGTWSATLIFEASTDGTNFNAISVLNVATNAFVANTTANGQFLVNVAGYNTIRTKASAFSSGTVNVEIRGSGQSSSLKTDGSGVTQPISAASLPLPSGAATETTLSSLNSKVTAVNTGAVVVSSSALPTGAATSANQSTIISTLVSIDNGIPSGLGQTTMVNSMSVAIASDQSTIPVSVASVPLPTGAATEATLAKLPLTQGSTTSGQSGVLEQGAVTTTAPSYTNGQTSPLSLTTAGALRTDASATTQPVSASSLPLPTGASTSALQTTGNSSLSSIDTKLSTTNSSLSSIDAGIPIALGQTTMSGGMPVTLATDQTGIPVKLSDATGNNVILGQKAMASSLPVVISSDQSSIPVVGNVASAATDSGNPVKIGGPFNTTQPTVTNGQRVDAQLTSRGAQIVATGIDNFNINNVSGTVSLPTGAATSALQTTGNTTLSTISGQLPTTLGAKTIANSVAVNIASDQTVPVSAASLPLPSGAATSANQTTEITSLQILDDMPHANDSALVKGVPLMGQLDDTSTGTVTENNVSTVRITAARSLHTNLRNNAGTEIGTSSTPIRVDPTGTTTQPISAASLPLPTGAATETSLVKLPLAQGSTTSGQSGILDQAAVTTNPPSYSTGQTSPLSLTIDGDLRTADIINTSGQARAQSVTTSAAEALGAGTILANRKSLTVTPTNGTVYWGYANTVTTSTGTPIFKNQTYSWCIGSNVHVYLIAGSTTDCRITEGS